MPATSVHARVTVVGLAGRRERGERVVCVTAYDYPTAVFADRAGIDMLLVGDSAAMTVLGHSSTLAVGMPEMLLFAAAVARGARRALVVGDMPFLSYHGSDAEAVRNAGAFLRVGCDAVKCEGGARIASRIRAITDAGIPAIGHLGLTPQNLSQLGGYRPQGTTLATARRIADDALSLQEAGIVALVLEAMPSEAARLVREQLRIPVYGIGAGPELDGQVMVSHDLLGTFVGDVTPRFVKRYAELGRATERAMRRFSDEVRSGAFPAAEHCYRPAPGHEEELRRAHATAVEPAR